MKIRERPRLCSRYNSLKQFHEKNSFLHRGFSNSRGLAAWSLFSVAVLLALSALGVFPTVPALAETVAQNPGASEVFQVGAGEHAAWSGDVPLGPAADTAYPDSPRGDIAPGGITPIAPTASSGGLAIIPTFDSSITGNPNAAAIEAMINQAVAIYQAGFSDPITLKIFFRYSNTQPNGSPMGTALARSNYVIYTIPWNTYINALVADAKTANDATANASLPASSLSASVVSSSASGRAVGLSTAPAMFADG